ncbi:MAG: epoxyqueuosine reductase QueH [bacterium]|nr:epoxyqueuosine reductase QueH [bacterium]MDT8365747.1 epoxyqueuosine reductase QueH [bacterium]
MKKLLIHICCAPDATIGIERLSQDWQAEGLFSNSNIHPGEEYEKRLFAMNTLAGATGFTFTAGVYEPEVWFESVKGLEEEPEKGLRCEVCIRERLRTTARLASDKGFDAFAAVLTVSPHKNAAMINRLGAEAGEEFGVKYLATDLKKQDGFKRSVEMTKEYGIYRQDYCGCEYSKKQNAGRPSTELGTGRTQNAEEKI